MRNIEKKLINKYNEFINEKINKLEISVEEKGGVKKQKHFVIKNGVFLFFQKYLK